MRAEVPDGEAGRPGRADGRHARVHRPRAAARPLLAGAARRSSPSSRRRRSRTDGDNARSIGHCYVERRHDAAQHLPRPATPERARARGARVRQRDPRPRDREHLPGRHALAELRRHPPRARRLLRLRRDRVPHRLHLPRDPAGAEPRGGALGRAVVPGRAAATSSRRSSRRSCSATHGCARRSCATTPTCSRPEFWQDCQRQDRGRRDRRLLPVPGVRCGSAIATGKSRRSRRCPRLSTRSGWTSDRDAGRRREVSPAPPAHASP